MFSLGVRSLRNKPMVLYAILQAPPKCCFRCKQLVYDETGFNLRRYLFSSGTNTFFEPCRELSTVMPKEENKDSNSISSRSKRGQVLNRRPVSFKVAEFIYTSNGMSNNSFAGGEINRTSTPNEETMRSWTSSKARAPRIFPQKADFKVISREILLTYLKDVASSSTRLSRSEMLKLENAFVYKLKEMTIHEMISVARYFFLIQHRAPKYLTVLFEYIDNNFDEVVSIEGNPLSHIMFYIYFHGSCPESLFQKMEHHLSVHLDELTLDDIGLACLGYFRANRRIRSFELLDQIAEKTIEKYSSIEPHHLIHTLKSFRHAGYSKISYFERLADLLVSNKTLYDMGLNQVMHVIMAFASTRIYHAELIHECMKRSVELVESSSPSSWLRTKELGRIVWAAGTLGVNEQDLTRVKMLVDAHTQIEKTDNGTPSVREYPESISDTVMGSVFLKIFPHELISLMLEEKTVNILQGLRGLEKKMQMLFIHHSVNIEFPNYSGPKLKKFLLGQFELKDRKRAVQFELDTRPGLRTLFEELTSILGEKNVHCHMILPHFTTADIEIHLDADNKPLFFEPETVSTDSKDSCSWTTQQQVTSDLLQMLRDPLKKQPSNSSTSQISRRIAVQVAGRNQCALNQSKWLMGIHRTKLRQLSAMDYEVLLLMPEDIANLEVCQEKRKDWVLQNIIQKLNINCAGQNL